MKKDNIYTTVLGPVITEKATIGSEHGQVSFRVAMNSTKPRIKKAIEELFSVKVKSVNTLRVKGKTKVFRGVKGRRSDWKKAVVTLEDGESIDVMGGV